MNHQTAYTHVIVLPVTPLLVASSERLDNVIKFPDGVEEIRYVVLSFPFPAVLEARIFV